MSAKPLRSTSYSEGPETVKCLIQTAGCLTVTNAALARGSAGKPGTVGSFVRRLRSETRLPARTRTLPALTSTPGLPRNGIVAANSR